MYFFEIIQDEIVVVSGQCEDLESTTNEVAHYISQYEQDGPIDEIIIRRKEK